jgi:hypothetical protein
MMEPYGLSIEVDGPQVNTTAEIDELLTIEWGHCHAAAADRGGLILRCGQICD